MNIIIIISLVLICVAIGTPYWSTSHVDVSLSENLRIKYGYNIGLWKGCINGTTCVSIPDQTWTAFPNDNFLACRWLSVVSAIFIFIGLVLSKRNRKLSKYLLLLGGVTGIAVSIIWYMNFRKLKFYSEEKAMDANLGYSFICNLVGSIIAVIYGVFLLIK